MFVVAFSFFFCMFFFFKKKTAYELSISDWISDVCSSDRRQAWAAGHTRSGKEGCIDPLGEDHFDLDAIGIEEVDLGVSGIGNRGSLEVHRMGAKVLQEGEQASAAEREVIERSGRSVIRLANDDVQARIIAAIGI